MTTNTPRVDFATPAPTGAPVSATASSPIQGDTGGAAIETVDRSRLALQIVIAGVLLGITADAVLRVNESGLGVTLWCVTMVQSLLYLRAKRGVLSVQEKWLVVPIVFFAAMFALRDSTVGPLNFLAMMLSFALLSFTMLTKGEWDIRRSTIVDYLRACVAALAHGLSGSAFLLTADKPFESLTRSTADKRVAPIVRGLALSAPLLLLFGALFMAADPVYDSLVTRVFDFDLEAFVGHVIFASVFTWLAAGYLRGSLLAPASSARWIESTQTRIVSTLTLGAVETGVVLGSVNALFLSFVLVQLRYLFGGAALVARTAGMTYAEYARHGFFELVFVALLVLPLLLVTRALLAPADDRGIRIHQRLSSVLLLLLGVVVVSALTRMRLYQEAFGLTEDRLFATVFMFWLTAVFAWFAATVMRGRPLQFAVGALASGLVTLGAVNAVNPGAFIVGANASRVAAGRSYDIKHSLDLGPDAVPALVESLPRLAPHDQCIAARALLSRWVPADPYDWRSANLGRWRARRAVKASEASLRSMLCADRPDSTSR